MSASGFLLDIVRIAAIIVAVAPTPDAASHVSWHYESSSFLTDERWYRQQIFATEDAAIERLQTS